MRRLINAGDGMACRVCFDQTTPRSSLVKVNTFYSGLSFRIYWVNGHQRCTLYQLMTTAL